MVDYHEGSGSSRLPSGTAKLVYNHKIMAKFESVGFREFKSFHNLFLKSGFNFRALPRTLHSSVLGQFGRWV
jgi:hypothetical protein